MKAGCTDSTRLNFDAAANFDSGLCTPWFYGCTISEKKGISATNFKSVYTKDDGSCSFPGCMTATNTNFRSFATFDDGSCARRRKLVEEMGKKSSFTKRPLSLRQARNCLITAGWRQAAVTQKLPTTTTRQRCMTAQRASTRSLAAWTRPRSITKAQLSKSDHPPTALIRSTAARFNRIRSTTTRLRKSSMAPVGM